MKLLQFLVVAGAGLVLGGAAFVVLHRKRPDLAQRLRGVAKEAAGQATGDDSLRAEGTADKTVGRVRQAAHDAIVVALQTATPDRSRRSIEAACPGTVTVCRDDGTRSWLIGLAGEHDLTTVPLLERDTAAVFDLCTRAIVDLSGATFIDCSGR